ncbi:TauD/TfdA family dioxygenase [Streptomyces adelaidensis]|uniref:TauD/TfdA family dioxygenase n=1 Tax=Streptomyces adelaidensis TaxID=2796465 RepID=UPI0019089CAB|nr:TauD/TfdA family dioxygenase [Streptomyces adelaidensis]
MRGTDMREERRTTGGTTLAVLHIEGRVESWDTGRLSEVRHRVEELLAECGAVMLRGPGVADADEFHRAVTAFGDPLIDSYRGGNTPRMTVSDGVFTSTEYPARFDISLHNELSYAHRWPSRLFFCCLVAPETGGATPVCDGRALLEDLPPKVRERFESGVVYRQHLHGGLGLGKSWQDTFETDDRGVVEEFLDASEAEYRWTAEGGLRVSQHRPGVRTNPLTGRDVWFNQADQWHPSNLPGDEGETLLSLIDDVDDLPHWVTYGDGTPIPDEDLAEVRAAARRNRLVEPWRGGDIMIVTNMSVLHGREAYTGPRKVVVSMT